MIDNGPTRTWSLLANLSKVACANNTYTHNITMGSHKSTVVARGANTHLDPSCLSAPPATNVDLFACFAVRLFESSSISYLPRVASDSLYVGMPWSIDRTANITPFWHSIERPATFHRLEMYINVDIMLSY